VAKIQAAIVVMPDRIQSIRWAMGTNIK